MRLREGADLLEELRLARRIEDDGVELGDRMQAEAGEGLAPRRGVGGVGGDEVEERHERTAAPCEQLELVEMSRQHAVAGVDHREQQIRASRCVERLRLLREAARRIARGEEPLDRLELALARRRLRIDRLEQADRVLETRRVEQDDRLRAGDPQRDRLDAARGGGARRDGAEVASPRERPQQRGLARIGVADDGDAKRLGHRGASVVRAAARRAETRDSHARTSRAEPSLGGSSGANAAASAAPIRSSPSP